ncbi:hypothetical protein Tsubulata_036670 [Turnera subulata]|uniref:Cytochrome P450 n=1 Tax=Turnera subulata TaxID=218843 RepID=A0A9Q0GFH7_9ROSI|nr:hypothetical protein Tsubulata_036670 [Turnera subulata]
MKGVANLFKLERFAVGVAKATNNNVSAFLLFGLGPMIEEKIALSIILQRYRFTLSPTYVHSPVDGKLKLTTLKKDNIYPYRFLHGDTKEITTMRNGAITKSMKISHQILPRIQPHVYSWTKLYAGVSEPELVKEVMNNKDGTILKAMIQNYADKLLGNGVFTSQGEKWMKMRKLANVDSLKGMIPAVIVCVGIMLERWR